MLGSGSYTVILYKKFYSLFKHEKKQKTQDKKSKKKETEVEASK